LSADSFWGVSPSLAAEERTAAHQVARHIGVHHLGTTADRASLAQGWQSSLTVPAEWTPTTLVTMDGEGCLLDTRGGRVSP
jgi:hypothetical protein